MVGGSESMYRRPPPSIEKGLRETGWCCKTCSMFLSKFFKKLVISGLGDWEVCMAKKAGKCFLKKCFICTFYGLFKNVACKTKTLKPI